MPPGVPVATMAINGSRNAGIMAAQILGAQDENIAQKVKNYRKHLSEEVLERANKLEKLGHEDFLKEQGII